MTPNATGPRARVQLYWLPLGAGERTGVVRLSGRVYEALAARREHRPRMSLFHSALVTVLDGREYTIEMAPVWSLSEPERGVVCEGAVGLPWLARSRLFRYEVRCWPGGVIPDLGYALGGPQELPTDRTRTARLLEIVPDFPTATWGLDELCTGEMWNSNSLISWVLAVSGHDTDSVRSPRGGRAPGWNAGLVVAAGLSRPEHVGRDSPVTPKAMA